ncbi:hypothetical protein [Pseudomonas laurylsulfatiphila]|uniref:hypothetical protein n=1 Tax=Pseudomonas laurylsulfatiphila TaxID=2011015 RepID=UPI00215DDEAF|nr:hypothetical protein [Pseudomonas laurylsulfatiphila]UVM07129.1 hypothetical protein LOY25_10680 [Pseudomonas laurylsulfatiphila]
MSKLLKLKEWLTVKDAAKRLSISTGEKIKEADVLRLALDGHLTLSVYFVNHAKGRPARIEPISLKHVNNAPSPSEYGPPRYGTIEEIVLPNQKDVIIYEADMDKPQTLQGVWDLPMIGGEKLDVEHLFQALTDGPEISLFCFGGPLVTSADRTKVFQILDSYECSPPSLINVINGLATIEEQEKMEPSRWRYEVEYYPADALPADSVFVVRVGALRELEGKLLADDNPPEKPLHPSERKSAGQIIAALSAMAKLDLSAPYAADETLRAAAAANGLELPSSPETVVKFLGYAASRVGKT